MDGPVVAIHPVRPFGDDLIRLRLHGERQVDVRPGVLGVERGRTGDRGAADAVVGASGCDQVVPQSFPFFPGEHVRTLSARVLQLRAAGLVLEGPS